MRWQAMSERPLGRGVDFVDVSEPLQPLSRETYVVVELAASVLEKAEEIGNALTISPC